MKRIGIVVLVVFFATLGFQTMLALADKTPEELAKETEAACTATESTKPTPEMIMEKVNKACALLQKEGKAGFSKFSGKDSEFVFAGTYIWIHNMAGVMLMHPIKYKMNGQSLVDYKDTNGKRFFNEMNKTAKEKGSGWVDYMWPKPGVKEPSQKVSFVKLCNVQGEDLVVGCGVYDLPEADVKKLLK
ncbi:MAG: cache domain-containing protein [Pseudomonadota bacterium]